MNTTSALIKRPDGRHGDGLPRTLTAGAVAKVLDAHDSLTDGRAALDPELRREMIATAAYFIAEQRGFASGHEIADWHAAEAAVGASFP